MFVFDQVPPSDPILESTEYLDDGRKVIRGNEGGDIIIKCLSQGGFPQPLVSLYLDSIQSKRLNGTSMAECDSTCNVTLLYTLTNVSRSLDRQMITCESSYPNVGVPGKKNATVSLYLNCKLTTIMFPCNITHSSQTSMYTEPKKKLC